MGSRKEREMQKELESCMTQGDPQLQVALGHPWHAQLPGDNVNAMPAAWPGSETTLTPSPQPSVHALQPDTAVQNPCISQ